MNNNEIISIEDGFQYSINIAYDLHNEKKLSSFIPTKSSLRLIEDILLSTKHDSSDRARVLVGAYGKGKSHIVLAILSLLNGTSIEKFSKMKTKITGSKLEHLIKNYQESKTRLLPVLITGNGTSISQNFLLALQRTLSENNLLDLMPDTNFKAAINVINRWKSDFPETFTQFAKEINEPINKFLNRLTDFDISAYKQFEELYPILTSGSIFNPFVGFDVTEIYESIVKSLKQSNSGYTGLYVVYDEFSKYLESNISSATFNDTKMLQDFAEKCNRSGENQLHLMLICHKEISNYIDTLPKQKVDGWRGISERFTHVHLNNNFTQTYEVIESVIVKNQKYNQFVNTYNENFSNLLEVYSQDATYNDIQKEDLLKIFIGCYPLHPISIYILPRLSERVAQNERTLFTFLSANGSNGLIAYLEKLINEKRINDFALLTPDVIYDYFEPLFQKEIYTEDLYKTYTLTTILLDKLDSDSLESKLVKTLSLIYILGQFERLAPTSTTLNQIFNYSYSSKEVNKALENLIEKECVVYLRRSNNFYSLKQSSGIDIHDKIQKTIESRNNQFSLKDVLNSCNFNKALYPLRYNDEKEITRYFSFLFINDTEIDDSINWNTKSLNKQADGFVYAILPSLKTQTTDIIQSLEKTKNTSGRCLFIIPKTIDGNNIKIIDYAKEYDAVKVLLESTGDDNILHDEYSTILNDLEEIIQNFIGIYTQSEKNNALYIYEGKNCDIKRKTDVTEKLSLICDTYFSNTPIIINESVNKNEPSTVAVNARNKIISSLLRQELEKNLALTGGQELAIMRSLLVKPGIIKLDDTSPVLNLNCKDKNLTTVFNIIKDFMFSAKTMNNISFASLYENLTTEKKKIGLRKGLIPVYIACIFHDYKKQISLFRGVNEVQVNTQTLCDINDNPSLFTIRFMDWTEKEDTYIENLSFLFKDYVIESEKITNTYEYVFNAIRRWYLDLPKLTKEAKSDFNNITIKKEYTELLKNIKNTSNVQELIFTKLTKFNTIEELNNAKKYFDSFLNNSIYDLEIKICKLFDTTGNIFETLKTWSSALHNSLFNTVYNEGLTRFLNLCKKISIEDTDSISLTKRIAFLSTDLEIVDWSEQTLSTSLKNIQLYKETAEKENKNIELDIQNNDSQKHSEKTPDSSLYEIIYPDSYGQTETKRFPKSDKSSFGNILTRALKSNLNSMGLSVTESEKRQILMELLIDLCEGKK